MDTIRFRPPPSALFGHPSFLDARPHNLHPPPTSAAPRPTDGNATAPAPPSYVTPTRRLQLRLWPRREDEDEEEPRRTWRGSWVMKILRVRSIWERKKRGDEEEVEEEEKEAVNGLLDEGDRCVRCCEEEEEEGCVVGDMAEEIDRESFSRLLRRASLQETEFYARMSYLGSLAYAIPKIKPAHLLKDCRMHFVTSSLDKKLNASRAETDQWPVREKVVEREPKTEYRSERLRRDPLSASGVYHIAASAASYVQSQTKEIIPFRKGDGRGTDSPERGDLNIRQEGIASSEKASFVVTSESVTAVVAAKEEVKAAVANDLNSSKSSPCEWFICDDDRSGTRYFVIQGSENLASWQANLLFEPISFEGSDVLVHRGIYEAAKGIYQQMLPEVRAHLESHGSSATLRFTGHSLGGSLSLLINLMLLIRGEAPASALLPVVTFGAPSILCGGNSLLEKLGLPRNHLQAITLHRDIVPRAFSCTYPDHVADILRAVNGKFRNHPCLKHQKLLYSPMGEILILQPEESFSPHHQLLPSGSGLYFLGHSSPDTNSSRRLLRMAFSVFLNSPHPLEILSDRSAYGSDGTVMRDHDVSSYLKSLRAVKLAERKHARKAQREHRRRALWPLLTTNGMSSKPGKIDISELMGGSQNVQMLIMLLLPVRMLVMQALTVATFV